MLATYPIKINSTAIPFPTGWSVAPKRLANNYETEAGTRQVVVLRNARTTFSGSWTVSSRWLKKFLEFRALESFTLSVYDVTTSAYADHTVSITDDSFSYELIEGSKRVKNSEGLYRVSFDMEDF